MHRNFLVAAAGLFVSSSVAVPAFAQTPAPAPFTMDSARALIDPADAPPAPTNANGLGDWAKCLAAGKYNQPIGVDSTGQLLPICQPDTLYSWGPDLKLQDFNQSAPAHSGPWLSTFARPIYATLNPATTWAYAEDDKGYLIRMKLKKGTHFLFNNNQSWNPDTACTQAMPSPLTIQNTVIAHYWFNGDPNGEYLTATDYIICSPGPIHSWSANMPRGYDELAASLIWNNSIGSGSNNWLPYAFYKGNNSQLFDGLTLDNHDWSSSAALALFQKFRTAATGGLGSISFAPDVPANDADHFSSAFKIYWHWAN